MKPVYGIWFALIVACAACSTPNVAPSVYAPSRAIGSAQWWHERNAGHVRDWPPSEWRPKDRGW
jgi:hypothetical protein